MLKLNADRSLQVLGLRLKSEVKKLPFLGQVIIWMKWKWNRIKNQIQLTRNQYPLMAIGSECYFKIDPQNLNSKIQLCSNEDLKNKSRWQTLNKIANESDFLDPEFKSLFLDLIEPVGLMQRKSWEFVCGIKGLRSLGCIHPKSIGIGVGSGCEKPIFYLANHCQKIVSTDLYLNNTHHWSHTSNSDIYHHPQKYSPFSYPQKNLEMAHRYGQDLQYQNNTFDFAFSFSSIEHFGSRENIAKTMQEIERVLKPNGIACISTEIILNHATHYEYFTPEELNEYIIRSHNMTLLDSKSIDWRMGTDTLSHIVDIDKNFFTSIDIVYHNKGIIFTPIILFFQKESSR